MSASHTDFAALPCFQLEQMPLGWIELVKHRWHGVVVGYHTNQQ
jgi:hypothetical protein